MTINLQVPDIRELRPRITVFGVGGAGGNAVNNMITAGLSGVDFVVANTDAQALALSKAERIVQMGVAVTEGLGAGSQPEVGRAAAEEALDEIRDHLAGAHMAFITAGMGGGTGTGAAPVIARAARELGILTVGVVTKPFHFEGQRRMRIGEMGIAELQKSVDTLIIIPNQNLFRVANEKTTFADAFAMADQVLYSGVACITDLMVKEGLINLDFADVRAVMREMGKAMMGTGEASGEKRALHAAEAAIANPLLDEVSMRGARGLLISITGGRDLTLFEVDEAATRIREEVDPDANIILGATFDETLEGIIRVSVVATGIDPAVIPEQIPHSLSNLADIGGRRMSNAGRAAVEARRDAALRSVASALSEEPSMHQQAYEPTFAAPSAGEHVYADTGYAQQAPMPAAAIDDVTIRQLPPKPQLYVEPQPTQAGAYDYQDEAIEPFIPPQAERPEQRAPRMPRVEELPVPAQNQIRAARGEPTEQQHAEKKRMTLLQRLAHVGLGRRDEEEEVDPPAEMRPVVRRAPQQQGYAEERPLAERRPESSEFAKRPAQRPVDAHGRPQAARPAEDDHLDIPAFLRRQG
ncbi:cell division protein FtsZ [Ancylobacter defluvii]|uniref:Cell division protein FtsZ n=1 Tax=Ancylobacter defluvii TaxID=1282440 RepID=A0A9W6JUU3_9HYPH|nr:cell division protein FtsZ [Ancylobacter defluvii]MBS7587573.1 cell division protein FtsZ [Ancylobacter defluvii]GLK82264.1 cell division protein FtsZ [Ancylobacter defluvii]